MLEGDGSMTSTNKFHSSDGGAYLEVRKNNGRGYLLTWSTSPKDMKTVPVGSLGEDYDHPNDSSWFAESCVAYKACMQFSHKRGPDGALLFENKGIADRARAAANAALLRHNEGTQ